MRTCGVVTRFEIVAMSPMRERKIHLRGALNNCLTKDETQDPFAHPPALRILGGGEFTSGCG
jgi:hypothetical protein